MLPTTLRTAGWRWLVPRKVVAGVRQRPRRLGADLRRAGAEAAVVRDELGGERDGGGVGDHRAEVTGRPPDSEMAA